jgi:integrase
VSGRVYRRCTCRDEAGKELGPRCPDLSRDGKHGKWGYAIDVPTIDKRRKTMRRHQWTTKKAATAALDDVKARYGHGVAVDDQELVADWLRTFMSDKRHDLKPKTLNQYSEYIEKDLVPALGAIRLEQLRHAHVSALITDMEAAGRGAPTIRRCVAVLSSALSHAVKKRRLTHNVAQHAPLPPEGREERNPWSAAEAVAFLDHVADHRLSALFEVLIGCGLRRGEALALRWADVDVPGRVLPCAGR